MKYAKRLVRKDRKKMAVALREFLNAEIDGVQLIVVAYELSVSPDPVVQLALEQVDIDLDMVVVAEDLSRIDWNLVQRILLLLESNDGIRRERQVFWSSTQWMAALCLAVIALISSIVGWQFITLVAAPFLIASWHFGKVRARKVARPYVEVLYPFGSFSQLRKTYEETPTFKKQKLPRKWIKPDQSGLMNLIDSMIQKLCVGTFVAILALVPPFSLLYQLLPIFNEKVDVVPSS